MSKPCNIQLVSNGDGQVVVIIDGRPLERIFDCEYSLTNDLHTLLEKHLVKYESQTDETLPF